MNRLKIREDDLTGSKVADFLQGHLDEMYKITPPESVHALDLAALRSPNITVYSAWDSHELLGCGALQTLDASSGEIKSMRTAKPHRGRGVASQVLEHILKVAQQRAYDCLYLETGAMPEFAPARALYLKYGFKYRSPFADYREDPNSVFMAKKLAEKADRKNY